MNKQRKRYLKGATKGRSLLAVVGILMVIALVAAACGGEEEAAPTATPRPAATPTATTAAPTLRTPAQWTVANPATFDEIVAEIEKHRGETFTFGSWGGAYQAAQRQAYLVPFSEEFGITIIEESQPDSARIRAMVDAGNTTWDVADLGQIQTYDLGAAGYLEELDYSVVDNRDLLAVGKTPWSAGGGITWSTGLAYSTDTYTPETAPKSWADFWDPNFPGRRGYGDYLTGHIEFPLLAAGFSPDEITYPFTAEQEEIIFQKLEDLAPLVSVFWSAGSTPPEQLVAGNVDMISAWNGRIFDAQLQGAPIAICWECGHVIATDFLVIPSGSPNKELAQLFIAWSTFPQINALITKYITYGPVNIESFPLLPDVVDAVTLAELPSSAANIAFAILEDEGWLGENYTRLNERYLAIFQE